MALGKRCGSGLGLGSGVVRYTRSMSGKRIAIASSMEVDCPLETEKNLNQNAEAGSKKFLLEALPRDLLVRILCGVDHDDLKQLFHVSKVIREATIIVKKWHFEFSTPTKKTMASKNWACGCLEDAEEIEAPNAPMQARPHRPRLNQKELASISVALFPSSGKGALPRRNLLMEMEADE